MESPTYAQQHESLGRLTLGQAHTAFCSPLQLTRGAISNYFMDHGVEPEHAAAIIVWKLSMTSGLAMVRFDLMPLGELLTLGQHSPLLGELTTAFLQARGMVNQPAPAACEQREVAQRIMLVDPRSCLPVGGAHDYNQEAVTEMGKELKEAQARVAELEVEGRERESMITALQASIDNQQRALVDVALRTVKSTVLNALSEATPVQMIMLVITALFVGILGVCWIFAILATALL